MLGLRSGLVLLMGCVLALTAGCLAPVTPPPSRPAVTTSVEGTWTHGATMPTARSEIAAAVVDGRIYVAGGLDVTGRPLAAFEAFTPEAPATPTPIARSEVTGRVWEDLNGNGQFDAGEPPLAGVRINLAQGACRQFAIFMDATVSDRDGDYHFTFPVPDPSTISVLTMMPARFGSTTPACQTVTFQETGSEQRSIDFGARRLWDVPVRASFLLEEEDGDQMWAGVSQLELVEDLAAYPEGKNWWFCGRVVPDPLQEW